MDLPGKYPAKASANRLQGLDDPSGVISFKKCISYKIRKSSLKFKGSFARIRWGGPMDVKPLSDADI